MRPPSPPLLSCVLVPGLPSPTPKALGSIFCRKGRWGGRHDVPKLLSPNATPAFLPEKQLCHFLLGQAPVVFVPEPMAGLSSRSEGRREAREGSQGRRKGREEVGSPFKRPILVSVSRGGSPSFSPHILVGGGTHGRWAMGGRAAPVLEGERGLPKAVLYHCYHQTHFCTVEVSRQTGRVLQPRCGPRWRRRWE